MKSSAKKIELASVDDLFSTEEGRQDAKLEKIQEIPLSELHPFKNHPFKYYSYNYKSMLEQIIIRKSFLKKHLAIGVLLNSNIRCIEMLRNVSLGGQGES